MTRGVGGCIISVGNGKGAEMAKVNLSDVVKAGGKVKLGQQANPIVDLHIDAQLL